MSGGGRGSRGVGQVGWEEAGAEFYQESYPGTAADLDLESFTKDPHYFATLLPSKQNRATTKRTSRAGNLTTFKRRNSGYYSTMGNNTVPNEIHCAMMPDLSQNLATEESTWEEIMQIKSMPVNMAQKKEMKAKLLSAETFRLQGLKQLKWRSKKMWERLKIKKKELLRTSDLWHSSIKNTAGSFGCGVAELFLFIRWLLLVNVVVAVVLGVSLVAPVMIMEPVEGRQCFPLNESLAPDCCQEDYHEMLHNDTDPWNLVLGAGWLQRTPLYYGFYPSALTAHNFKYDIALVWPAAWLVSITAVLLFLVKRGTSTVKSYLVEHNTGGYKYCNVVFMGWDFCLCTEKGREGRHGALVNTLREWFEEEDHGYDGWGRWAARWCAKAVATGVVAAQGAVLWFIWEAGLKTTGEGWWVTVLGYLPAGGAFVSHAVIPALVQCLTPVSQLTRAAAPRFATLTALLGSFYYVVHCRAQFDKCWEPCPPCWETLFAQHTVRLLIAEAALLVLGIVIDLPRALCRPARFHPNSHLAHLIYCQTLVLLGAFYSPVLPALYCVLLWLFFYQKKISCWASRPSTQLYRAASSSLVCSCAMLCSLIVCMFAWGYALIVLPSKSCGPHSHFTSVISVVESAWYEIPVCAAFILTRLVSGYITLPLLGLLICSLLFYYWVGEARKDLICSLRRQLVLEGHDKQFLLNRLSALIKQHQERHKGPRSLEPPPPPATNSS